ncbi:MAG: autotransporter outer membrane beta-barrel domain-containing protein [Bradyrhizobium sp.]
MAPGSEVNAGLDAQITKATSLFASVGYQVSTNGNMTAYNGKGGLRVAW